MRELGCNPKFEGCLSYFIFAFVFHFYSVVYKQEIIEMLRINMCRLMVILSEKWKCLSLSHVWLFVTPLTVAWQAPLSMAFPRQEYWSGLPFPSPGDPPRDQGPNPGLLCCRQILCHLSHWGSLWYYLMLLNVPQWFPVTFSIKLRSPGRFMGQPRIWPVLESVTSPTYALVSMVLSDSITLPSTT